MNFPIAIPENPALQSGDDRDRRAGAIVAGEVIGTQVQDATEETENRKRLRLTTANVSFEEVEVSRRRQKMVEVAEAQVMLGLGNLGVAEAVNALGRQINAMEQQMNALGEKVDMLGEKMDTMGERVETLGFRMDNQCRRKQNNPNAWTPLVVDRVGANPIGHIPRQFPKSSTAVFGMTRDEITNLEQALNLPTGHFGEGSISERRKAVFKYCTEDVVFSVEPDGE